MDTTCRFPLEYRAPRAGSDPVLDVHLRNCPDCRDQVFDLRAEA